MRIDAFAHILPEPFRQAVLDRLPTQPILRNWRSLRGLWDVEARLRLLDAEGVDRQVVMTTLPALEDLFDAQTGAELARRANDAMAELVAQHPDRFYGVATVSLLDPDAAARELERAVRQLGLLGAQIYSNVAGRPLDQEGLEVFWQKAEEIDAVLWLHPSRMPTRPDYVGEDRSRYRLYSLFGWPYDTTLAMARLVMGGVIARHPRLKIVAHHGGAMVPYFVGRVELRSGFADERETVPDGRTVLEGLRRFYVDTCTWGSVAALLACQHAFGSAHMILGSDVPYGPEEGRQYLRRTIASVEYLPVSAAEREGIFAGNFLRLIGRSKAPA